MNRMLQFDEWKEAVRVLYEGVEQNPQAGEGRVVELYAQMAYWKAHIESETLRPWEARLYTCLGFIKWNRLLDVQQAENWLRRAVQLDSSLTKAWDYFENVLLCRLSSLFTDVSLPSLRQVDPSEYRKQKVLEIQQQAQQLVIETLKQAEQWLTEGRQASRYKQREDKPWDIVASMLAELPEIVREVEERALAYQQSIHGLYASDEMRRELNEALVRLNKQIEAWNEQLASYRRETVQGRSALERLRQLIGMKEVKKRIHDLYHFLLYLTKRNEQGLRMKDDIGLHAILMGNPGTGKTTIARLLAELYHELGLLERPAVVEVDRSHLVGSYVGQTEQKVMETIQRAVGGVLFIDEAYSLKRAGSAENDFGQVAIDTLVAAMTSGEYAGKFVVVLAGYPEEMRNFLLANPGLRSRFPESGYFYLPDFTMEELSEIGQQVAHHNGFMLTESALQALTERIERERVDATFGNARTVKNIVLDAITAKGRKLANAQEWSQDEFTILYEEDFRLSLPTAKPATERLHALVGLTDIKEEIRKLFSFLSIQQKRKEEGLPVLPLQLHAVFSGNPGTGKTTVADIYASILKEVGILKRGHVVTVGRADLVAEYVGQTAAKTKRKIMEALGGVLFIDEAHALIPTSPNDYSAEALDTLVEEMTKHNENLVVVLAGYPELMDKLLDANPGLRSRFKKYFHFPDYSVEQLMEVAVRYARDIGYHLSMDALSYLRTYFAKQNGPSCGNARFARAVIEEAVQHQAKRLMESGKQTFTREELMQLEETDIRLVSFI
jgi:SpoVK/Ycf46/Vps4 family AAA+-type ATPase